MSASPKHPNARSRARQTAARHLAAQEGITYQQALRRLELPWFAAVAHLALSAHSNVTPSTALQAALAQADGRLDGPVELQPLDAYRDHDGALTGVVLIRIQAEDPAAAQARINDACEQLPRLPGVDDAHRNSWERLLSGRDIRVRLSYLYRDADNYKAHHSLVLEGLPQLGDLEMLRAKLDDGEHFIPGQVSLPDLQGDLQQLDSDETVAGYEADPSSDPDHPWHELDPYIGGESIEITDRPSSDGEWAHLMAEFRAVQWDESWPYRN